MSEQENQREAERYREYQAEQEAYEQAHYDDELSKALDEVGRLSGLIDRIAAEVEAWRTEETAVGPVLTGTSCANRITAILTETEQPK